MFKKVDEMSKKIEQKLNKLLTCLYNCGSIYIDWYSGNFRSPESFYFKDGELWKNIKAVMNY